MTSWSEVGRHDLSLALLHQVSQASSAQEGRVSTRAQAGKATSPKRTGVKADDEETDQLRNGSSLTDTFCTHTFPKVLNS